MFGKSQRLSELLIWELRLNTAYLNVLVSTPHGTPRWKGEHFLGAGSKGWAESAPVVGIGSTDLQNIVGGGPLNPPASSSGSTAPYHKYLWNNVLAAFITHKQEIKNRKRYSPISTYVKRFNRDGAKLDTVDPGFVQVWGRHVARKMSKSKNLLNSKYFGVYNNCTLCVYLFPRKILLRVFISLVLDSTLAALCVY